MTLERPLETEVTMSTVLHDNVKGTLSASCVGGDLDYLTLARYTRLVVERQGLEHVSSPSWATSG